MSRPIGAAGVLLACLIGCGEPPPDPAAKSGEAAGGSVFDPLAGTLDRAAGVQDTVDQRAAELRQRLEEAEGRRE